MDIGMSLKLKEELSAPNPLEKVEADRTDFFSSKHVANSEELAARVFSMISHIWGRAFYNTPVQIYLFPVQRNGMKVIARVDKTRGYACTVYAIAKNKGIGAALVDCFSEEKDISSDISEFSGKLGYYAFPSHLEERVIDPTFVIPKPEHLMPSFSSSV